MDHEASPELWWSTIARSLAYLCLQTDEGRQAKSILEKANFLRRLGLPLEDAAALAGSSVASIRELDRQARNKGKSNGKGKKKARKNK